jgi:hypothetical protein
MLSYIGPPYSTDFCPPPIALGSPSARLAFAAASAGLLRDPALGGSVPLPKIELQTWSKKDPAEKAVRRGRVTNSWIRSRSEWFDHSGIGQAVYVSHKLLDVDLAHRRPIGRGCAARD